MLNCSLRSRGSRSKPPSSSHLVKRQLSRNSLDTLKPLHHLLLQIGAARSGRLNCSLRSRGSRSKPPSSSHLVKPQLPHNSLDTPKPLHHLLLQIGGARSGRLNCSLCISCSLRSRDGWDSAPSSPTVNRDPRNRDMRYPLHVRLLQSPEASINSRGSDSGRVRFPPKAQEPTSKRPFKRAFAMTVAKTYAKGPP